MSNHQPIKLFISYSHQDEDLLKKLESHLALLKSQKIIDTWHDRKIGAGCEWQSAIDTHLEDADIILLLISADFLASDYCIDVEMRLAMKRHWQGSAQVVPVALRPCDSNDADFMKLEGLPTDFKAVTLWSNQDEAFTNIAKGIRKEAERRHLVKPPVADLFGHFEKVRRQAELLSEILNKMPALAITELQKSWKVPDTIKPELKIDGNYPFDF